MLFGIDHELVDDRREPRRSCEVERRGWRSGPIMRSTEECEMFAARARAQTFSIAGRRVGAHHAGEPGGRSPTAPGCALCGIADEPFSGPRRRTPPAFQHPRCAAGGGSRWRAVRPRRRLRRASRNTWRGGRGGMTCVEIGSTARAPIAFATCSSTRGVEPARRCRPHPRWRRFATLLGGPRSVAHGHAKIPHRPMRA